MLPKIETEPKAPSQGFFKELISTYDGSFLFCITLQYFLSGFKIFVDLSVKSLFKDYLFLQPSQTQSLNTIIGLPWTVRFLYGIISDSLPVFGSRKRGYYILMSILAIVFLIPLMFPTFLNTYAIAALLVLNNVTLAFNDVITDSIIVLQSRIDPKSGAKILNSYARSLQAAGGIVGSFSAAYMT